jgi:hypothetical protein
MKVVNNLMRQGGPKSWSLVVWEHNISAYLMQFFGAYRNVSVYMLLADGARQQRSSQVTAELWFVSIEHASCDLLAPRIWKWLVYFGKLVHLYYED